MGSLKSQIYLDLPTGSQYELEHLSTFPIPQASVAASRLLYTHIATPSKLVSLFGHLEFQTLGLLFDMRSPVVAFSLLAAAATVSASITGTSNSPQLGPGSLTPKLDSLDRKDSGLDTYVHRREAGTGLGIPNWDAHAPAHYKREFPARAHANPAENESRPTVHEPRPRPEPPMPNGAVTGCSDPSTVPEDSTVIANGILPRLVSWNRVQCQCNS